MPLETCQDADNTSPPWWFSLSISLGIYLLNILYLVLQWIFRFRRVKLQQKKEREFMPQQASEKFNRLNLFSSHLKINSSDDEASSGSEEAHADYDSSSSNPSIVQSINDPAELGRGHSRRFSLFPLWPKRRKSSIEPLKDPMPNNRIIMENGDLTVMNETNHREHKSKVKFYLSNRDTAESPLPLGLISPDFELTSLLEEKRTLSLTTETNAKICELLPLTEKPVVIKAPEKYITRRILNWLASHKIGFWSVKNQLKIKLFCEQLTSVSYPKGRFLAIIFVILSTFSWITYIIGTLEFDAEQDRRKNRTEDQDNQSTSLIKGYCQSKKMDVLSKIDMIIHLYFLAYFMLRFCASNNRRVFLFRIQSFVEVITIPSSIMNAFQRRIFLDLDFMRAINIFKYGEVLTYMGFLTTNRRIQTAQLFFAMFAMWMIGAGIMHLLEGINLLEEKPPVNQTSDGKVREPKSYFDACYFLLVTMSTVGYGDMTPDTVLTKVFVCIFVPVSMGFFASFVPELIRSFDAQNLSNVGRYRTIFGQKHVLVCGHFTNESVRSFLKGFFHVEHANRRKNLNMVILRPQIIDLALKAILTKYHAWVHYFNGTPNNPQDLSRISLRDARAAIVLGAPNSKFSDEEDGANIMQAITLKAQRQRLRVLVQLHHSRNKCMLHNFPRWTCLSNDMVICMDELKLGLMAYNCMAAGFATLILNLLNSHRSKIRSDECTYYNWRHEYEYGLSMELYDVGISPHFHKLDCNELAIFIYKLWGNVLLAIRDIEEGNPPMIINPAQHRNLLVNSYTMRAIVLSTNDISARKLEYYCVVCNAHIIGHPCTCTRTSQVRRRLSHWMIRNSVNYQVESANPFIHNEDTEFDSNQVTMTLNTRQSALLANDLRNAALSSASVAESEVSLPDAAVTSLQHMVTRTTNLYEWQQLAYTPVFHDRTGTFHWINDVPISRATLTPSQASQYNFQNHLVLCLVGPTAGGPLNLANFIMPFRFHWLTLRSIVILGDINLISQSEWVKLKNFPRVYIVNGCPCSFTDLQAVKILQCVACCIIGDSGNCSKVDEADESLQDKNTLFCAMNIRSLLRREERSIHMTTELRHENNAHHFTTANAHDTDLKLPLRFQEPFARGIIFSNSLLYSSISSLYFNGDVFLFLRVLIAGQSTDEIESSFAFGSGLQREGENKSLISGVRVQLRAFHGSPFNVIAREESRMGLKVTYKLLFERCLMYWRILILGLYRMNEHKVRYVFTNPPGDTVLMDSDKVYCFIPPDYTPPTMKETPKVIVMNPDD